MKVNISKEWCENMARLENDSEIGAGVVGRDPCLVMKTIPGTFDDYSRCSYDELWSAEAADAATRPKEYARARDAALAKLAKGMRK